jgi:hypothetical protein
MLRRSPGAGEAGKDGRARSFHDDSEGANAKGSRFSSLLAADEGNDAVVTVIFEDKDSYFEMVHDPKTDENFGKIMVLLEGEPSWTDGEWHTTSA